MDSRRVMAPLGLAASLLMACLLTWWWRVRIIQTRQSLLHGAEAWERIKEAYPLVPSSPVSDAFSAEMLNTILEANPFSPQRRFVPRPQAERPTQSSETPGAAGFAYKGQISVGSRRRAILADIATGKTHFLEVGQEVAGFKVLDISQNQVVLSDSQTHEELVLALASSASAMLQERGRRAPSRTP